MAQKHEGYEERKAHEGQAEHEAHEPTIAPGMNTSDPFEEKASEQNIRQGEYTEVTRLYLDRTPKD